MFLDEKEIRRSLSRRAPRRGEAAWPEIRVRLEARAPATGRARLAIAAVVFVLVAASFWRRPMPSPVLPSKTSQNFQVSRVESRGRPSAAMILRPDRDTLIVIVPD